MARPSFPPPPCGSYRLFEYLNARTLEKNKTDESVVTVVKGIRDKSIYKSMISCEQSIRVDLSNCNNISLNFYKDIKYITESDSNLKFKYMKYMKYKNKYLNMKLNK